MPILFAYVIPGIGTNKLHLWTFNTRFRLGNFRPHHGFVFGTATSLLTLLVLPITSDSISGLSIIRAGFVLGSVLAFWNWLYDIVAIKTTFIQVYNRPYAANLGPEAIATDYAPMLFGVFGLCYGMAIRTCQLVLLEQNFWDYYWLLLIICNGFTIAVPVLSFMGWSFYRYGDAGLKPFYRTQDLVDETKTLPGKNKQTLN